LKNVEALRESPNNNYYFDLHFEEGSHARPCEEKKIGTVGGARLDLLPRFRRESCRAARDDGL
jgi:hypothetical protein